MNVDYHDILNLHDIEFKNCLYFNQAVKKGIPAFLKLKEQGKIRFFGVAAYSLILSREDIPTTLICTANPGRIKMNAG